MGTRRADIDDFLAQDEIAIVGVSRKPQALSHKLMLELRKRGKRVIPVNPAAQEIGGLRAYGCLSGIEPVPPAVLLMVNPSRTPGLLQECRALGAPRVWAHFASLPKGGLGAEIPGGDGYVIQGECPFMFLPGAGFIHRLHAGILKLAGTYPQ